MAKTKRKSSSSEGDSKDTVALWVDGSFRPPDNASCAYLIYSDKKKDIVDLQTHAFRGYTINQMELMAVNLGLNYKATNFIIYSDSMYVISALTLWYKAWERNNWITPNGEPVKNKELIQLILSKIAEKQSVKFVKVKSHSGVPFNTIVDFLAQDMSRKMVVDPSITQTVN